MRLREWRPDTLFVIDRWDAWSGKDLEKDLAAFVEQVSPWVQTVVLVTHEHDIAAWAGRRIVFRDGAIVEDVRQPPRAPVLPGHAVGGVAT